MFSAEYSPVLQLLQTLLTLVSNNKAKLNCYGSHSATPAFNMLEHVLIFSLLQQSRLEYWRENVNLSMLRGRWAERDMNTDKSLNISSRPPPHLMKEKQLRRLIFHFFPSPDLPLVTHGASLLMFRQILTESV